MHNTKQTDLQYVAGTYGRFDVALDHAKGATYVDESGKTYIDLGTGIGVTAFGAGDQDWVATVTDQLNTLGHVSNLYYTAPQAKLAKLLCEKTGMKKVFYGNSGAEANECALKVARRYGEATGRSTIVTLWKSFHGRTIATLAATGQDKFHAHFGPFPEGFMHIHANDAAELTAALTSGKVCAILMEMVQGEGGVIPLEKEYVQLAEKLCRENDVLLMIDEVQTGNGRTGSLYAYQQFGVTPDVVTTAKGLGGGLPIGACLMGEKVEFTLGKGDHGSTYGGNPVCAAAALNVISRMNDDLFEGVKARAAYIRSELADAEGIESVTGMGLMLGIDTEKPAGEVIKACMDNGVLVLSAHGKVRLLPALNLPMDQLEKALAVIVIVCGE